MNYRWNVTTPRSRAVLWACWVVFALLLLDVVGGAAYAAAVVASAALVAAVPGALPVVRQHRDHRELAVIACSYVGVVTLFSLAFRVFTADHVLGLFLCFAAGLLLGVVGPIYYTVWYRGDSLRSLGIRRDNWRATAVLAIVFGAVQFALTLWGIGLPAYEDWVPLLVMAMVVGLFESIFFRGFIQTRLEQQFGHMTGILGAAALYGLYHVGYGMEGSERLFLGGLGVVYAIAFAVPRNVFVLWPLLTPLGSFYNSVTAGEIDLPWASILGFADVLMLMLAAGWLAQRHVARRGKLVIAA